MAKKADKPVDRRVTRRLGTCIAARIWVFGSPTPAYSKDISSAAIRVRITAPCRFKVGESYRMEVEVPRDTEPIRTVARVVRIIHEPRTSDRWDIALQFDGMGPNDKDRIRAFIRRREAERRKLDLE